MEEDYSRYIEDDDDDDVGIDCNYPGWRQSTAVSDNTNEAEINNVVRRSGNNKSGSGDDQRKSQSLESFVRKFQTFFPGKGKKAEVKTNQLNKLRSFSFSDCKMGKQYEPYSVGPDGYPQFGMEPEPEMNLRRTRRTNMTSASTDPGDRAVIDNNETTEGDNNWAFTRTGQNEPRGRGTGSRDAVRGLFPAEPVLSHTNASFVSNSDEDDSLLNQTPPADNSDLEGGSSSLQESTENSTRPLAADEPDLNYLEDSAILNEDRGQLDSYGDYLGSPPNRSPPSYKEEASQLNSITEENHDLPPSYEEGDHALGFENGEQSGLFIDEPELLIPNEQDEFESARPQVVSNADQYPPIRSNTEDEGSHYWSLDQVDATVGNTDLESGQSPEVVNNRTPTNAVVDGAGNPVLTRSQALMSPVPSYADDSPKKVFRSPSAAAGNDDIVLDRFSQGLEDNSHEQKGKLSNAWKRISSYFSMKREKSWAVDAVAS